MPIARRDNIFQFICIFLCFILVLTIIPTGWAHDEPLPGSDSISSQGQESNNRPQSHPSRKFLHTDKGRLTGGNASSAGALSFSSFNIELLSQLSLTDLGAGTGVRGNDIWGWTDPLDDKEYALVGRSNATSFVDVSDPVNPVYLGYLPSATGNTTWRDIKVYANHAYIVSDNNGAHGMQVFDLTQLRSVTNPPVIFAETAHYAGINEGHNVVINENTGYAYIVGAETYSGGMHFVDISNPTNPVSAGGYSGDGYTHDAQVVTYAGPDNTYVGREIAFNSNTDTLTIVDVTDKITPVQLSRTGYGNSAYTHQGWLTEDHSFFISNDELDERDNPDINFTRTHLWNVSDLDAPLYIGYYEATVQSIDHNLYTHDGLIFAANYTSGLRVLDYADIANGNLNEVAYIDTHPSKDSLTSFDGIWSSYPFFPSGTIIIGDRDEGLIVVRLLKADIAANAVDTPDPVLAGAQLSYTIDVINNGPDIASNVLMTSVLPPSVGYLSATPSQGTCNEANGIVTCTLGALSDQSTATISITVIANIPDMLSNNISVSADEIDSDSNNNMTTLVTTVLPDQDGDGLDDAFENTIGTDPLLTDTDMDGISDYDEVAYDGDATSYTPGQDLNPLSSDSDNDSYSDSTDPIPLTFNYNDGDLAPVGAPDGLINVADYVIAQRISIGSLVATTLELSHGDLYPPGAPDGVINVSDQLLLLSLIVSP